MTDTPIPTYNQLDRVQTAAAVLHYAEGTLGPVAFHPDGCATCSRAVDLVGQVDRTYPAEADPMPVFIVKGKDRLAPDTVDAYFTLCLARGLGEQAAEVADAAREIRDWQSRNPGLVKLPDHPHVPASSRPKTNSYSAIERDAETSGDTWTHGTRLGRDHRSVRQHLVEDHGVTQAQVDEWSDGAVHGHHDGVHRTTWAYAAELAHPAPGDHEYQTNSARS